MFKYAMALKPIIIAGGIEELDETKKVMFHALLNMMAKFFESTPEVESAVIRDDYTLIITANEDVWDLISSKLGESAVVSRL